MPSLQVLCMRDIAVPLAEGVGKENRLYYVTAQDRCLTQTTGSFIPVMSGVDVGCLKLEDPSDLVFVRDPSELHDVLGFEQVPIHIFEDAGLKLCKFEPPLKRKRCIPERFCP